MRLPYMAPNRIRRDKHTTQKLLVLTTAVTFTIISSLPSNALAFESGLSGSVSQRLVAPVQLGGDAQQDVLAVAVATYSPITSKAQPEEEPEKKVAQATVITPVELPTPVTPAEGTTLVLEGEASYYSRAGCLGCSPTMTMANGQPLDDNALTMAIGADKKHLVGHTATVTNLATNQSVTVRITDTGGFYKAKYGNRVADLTIATKQAIGMNGGVGQVRVEVH